MTKLAASIMVYDLEQALASAARAAEFGAELVELRIDQFTADGEAIRRLIERCPLPCIVTCRPRWEGGTYDGDEPTRLAVFEELGAASRRPAYVDVELAAYQRSPQLRQVIDKLVDHPGQQGHRDTGLILSSHDFTSRPSDLHRKIKAMADEEACRVIKVAWKARSLRDNLEAFEILREQYKPAIALCMDELGLPSRVLAKKFGALLTFASLDRQAGTAPGQPTLTELKDLYRWDKLGRDTAVFGVIGYPVGHSLSPHVHNAGFDAVGFDGVYLPMPIPPEYEHFKATVASWLAMPALHFRGASVTIPHKENLLRYVAEHGHGRDEVEPLAAEIGAANTLLVRADGSLYAGNTDYAAAIDAVCAALNVRRPQLAGKRIAVIGAGGAARAIVCALAHYGAHVRVYNRTPQRAAALAERYAGKAGEVSAGSLEEVSGRPCDVLINCTPIGMYPRVEASPLERENLPPNFGPGVLVFDTIYNPAETKLLREAKAAGCLTIGGLEMFVRQAAAQFQLWTGEQAPIETFRRVLSQHMPV
jgi:3-dehydroquinate dehydratase/shikimate dehydrogenase